MAPEHARWWNDDELEVAELMWCAAHLHLIWSDLPQPDRQSQGDAGSRPPYPGKGLRRAKRNRDIPPPQSPERLQANTPVYPKGRPARASEDREQSTQKQPASPIRIPDPFPFPDAREIAQAIAPLARRIAGTLTTELDAEATAIATAEANGLLSPVLRGPQERWLELHLLVDCSPSMAFWGDLSAGAADLFRWQGLFRDVRVWEFHTGDAAKVSLRSGGNAIDRDVRSLHAPGHERIFLVLTDTLGRAWRSQKAFDWLRSLGETHPVHLAHIFPRELWARTALSEAILRPLNAPLAACSNQELQVEGRLPMDLKNLLRFPIFNLSHAHMKTWAKHICADGGNAIQGVLLEQTEEAVKEARDELEDGGNPAVEQDALAFFWTYASEEARELAQILAALPLIPPVMRLAQERFLSDKSQYWHLAEVFFSGMIQKSSLGPQEKGVAESFYDFKADYRKRLLGASSLLQSVNVMEGMGAFIEEKYGSMRDFAALIPNERGELQEDIKDSDLYFAKVRGSVLKLLGGDAAVYGGELVKKAEERERQLGGEDVRSHEDGDEGTGKEGFPELQELKFWTGQFAESSNSENSALDWPLIVEETVQAVSLVFEEGAKAEVGDAQEGLEEFTFEIATLKRDAAVEGGWRVRKKHGASWRFVEDLDDDLGLEMVAIQAGISLMGSPKDELERYDNEGPRHEVRLKGFYMGRYPVTQEQWQFVAEHCEQVNRPLKPSPARFKGARNPVETVSWFEAVEFCDRLSRHTGRTYRLPSEAEWEYACRAGTRTPFNFGDVISAEVANYYSEHSYNGSPTTESPGQTTPVDRYGIANGFGLSDMHGNVWEWCLDQWHDSYEEAPDDGSAWIDNNNNEKRSRVRRGGSWGFNPMNCRSAYRLYISPRESNYIIGFRVVCEAPRALQ